MIVNTETNYSLDDRMRPRIIADMSVKKNLSWLLAKNRMNSNSLFEATKVPQPTIHRILTGESQDPRTSSLMPIARYFGVTVADLRERDLESEASTLPGRSNVEPGPDLRGHVPLISWVQAGEWSQIVDNFIPGEAEDWMPCPRKYGPHTFALRVRGVSMEPRYQDGDIIFVDPGAQAEHGKNVVVRLDDEHEATFKQLVVEGGQKFLKPLNPDWPGPKLIQINGNATICGVVIGKWVPE